MEETFAMDPAWEVALRPPCNLSTVPEQEAVEMKSQTHTGRREMESQLVCMSVLYIV